VIVSQMKATIAIAGPPASGKGLGFDFLAKYY
jgi:cytidylate kinase